MWCLWCLFACDRELVASDVLGRCATKIEAIASQGLDVAQLWRACGDVIAEAVPHFMEPCWFTLDPASCIVTSHFDPVEPQISGDYLAHEYGGDDVWKLASVVTSGVGSRTVHEATDGHPDVSECWRRFVAAYGAEQELIVPLRSRGGTAWATLSLYREPGQVPFSSDERSFLETVSRPLADGVRRGLLVGEVAEQTSPLAPCMVVVAEDWSIESMTPGTLEVFDLLPGPDDLPTPVRSVAAAVIGSRRATAARVRDRSGRWLTLHGAPLLDGARWRAAVIIERSDPDQLSPLLMDLYALTAREKDVTRLVLQGSSTREIAAELSVADQTVQQHLKSIFDKTGVASRREVVGKIFFAHYEPRLRDNERRTARSRPIRGGPMR